MKKRLIKLLLYVFLVAWALLTFMGGIGELVINLGDFPEPGSFMGDEMGYFPWFCCIITAVELLLLIFGKGKKTSIIGLILHVIKVAVPACLCDFIYTALSPIAGLISGYRVSLFGIILIIFGVFIGIMYLVLIASGKNDSIGTKA